ncbi:hypothetical protein V5F53_12300 [Xanthobacter sp. V4C-4]|uniref:hypothetical protein n=1 Tax=Xanthobacter cornucopiae TaxID=3119924 RepID=UPI00372CDFA2
MIRTSGKVDLGFLDAVTLDAVILEQIFLSQGAREDGAAERLRRRRMLRRLLRRPAARIASRRLRRKRLLDQLGRQVPGAETRPAQQQRRTELGQALRQAGRFVRPARASAPPPQRRAARWSAAGRGARAGRG